MPNRSLKFAPVVAKKSNISSPPGKVASTTRERHCRPSAFKTPWTWKDQVSARKRPCHNVCTIVQLRCTGRRYCCTGCTSIEHCNLEDATAAQRQCRQTSPRTPICLFVDINVARAQHADVCMEFSHSSSSHRRRMVVRKWTDSPSGFGHTAASRTAVSNEVIRSILQNVQAHQADPLLQPTQHAVNLDARHLDGHTNTGGSA